MRTCIHSVWGFVFLYVLAILALAAIMEVLRSALPRRPLPKAGSPSRPLDERDEQHRQAFAEWQEQVRKQLSERIDQEAERGPIRCRVRSPFRLFGSEADTVEISLVNEGNQTLRFWHTIFGLKEHVTMLLRHTSGEVVAHLHWKMLSSTKIYIDPETRRPTGEAPVRILEPGAAERHLVYPRVILNDHYGTKIPPGRYSFQAIFEYSDLGGFPEPNQNLFARSQRIPVEVSADDVRVLPE